MSANLSRRSGALQGLESLGIWVCGLAAASHLVFAVYGIWVYGFSELFADQFRAYRVLATVRFPVNLVVPDNGHPQAFSNLIRYLEIRMFAADQTLGVLMGLAALLLAVALIVRVAVRDTAQPRAMRAAAVLLGTLALGWAGSARMQCHGNESFMTYWVICTAILGGLAAERAVQRRKLRWLGVAAPGYLGLALLRSRLCSVRHALRTGPRQAM